MPGVITCVWAVFIDPLNSAVILKIGKTDQYSTAAGPISTQFGRLMQNNMPITVM